MKKLLLTAAVLAVGALSFATPDISYSSDDDGYWSYTAADTTGEGVFSFIQPVGIDSIQGDTTDTLTSAFLYIPDLTISNLAELLAGSGIYTGNITPATTEIAIKDAAGNDILVGELTIAGVLTAGTTASLYQVFQLDITITELYNDISSDLISSLSVGDTLDFDLTINGSNVSQIVLNNTDVANGGTFSGSLTIIPEPLTLVLLGLGGLFVRKK